MEQPSDAELEVLKCFWRKGPMSARELHDLAAQDLGWALSTTRTVLERMRVKGLLKRSSVHGMAVYSSATGKAEVIGPLMRRLVRGVLEMDGVLPASTFSGSHLLDAQDLAEIEKILNASPKGES
ncbi:MAG: BlaI/MecI/CopY family transcriptional regulator [Caulobacteraceae bacterium]